MRAGGASENLAKPWIANRIVSICPRPWMAVSGHGESQISGSSTFCRMQKGGRPRRHAYPRSQKLHALRELFAAGGYEGDRGVCGGVFGLIQNVALAVEAQIAFDVACLFRHAERLHLI